MTEPLTEQRLAEIESKAWRWGPMYEDSATGNCWEVDMHKLELVKEVRRLRARVRELGGEPDV